ncbi:MAG: elongation factor P [Parcubacteria group bacterium]|nr:elongation factor P [Parcubacteria group bacterium]
MSVLSYSEIEPKKIILFNGDPYEVVSSHVFNMQMRRPVNQTKLRNLKNGKVIENTFRQSETVKEAELEYQNITFIYHNRGEYWFCEEGNPKNRFKLDRELIGSRADYLKANTPIEAMKFDEKVIGIKIPPKMELKVVEAPPSMRGNTAQGGNKKVTLETGAVVSTPLFININDVIAVNTETGEYMERINKA